MARHDFTDADMATKLGITREGFAKKKKSGYFTMPEIRLMLAMFGTSCPAFCQTDTSEKYQ